jgi:hypothetical protein
MSPQQVILRDEMEMRPGKEGRAAALKALAGVVVIALMSLILMATGGDDAKKHAQREAEARANLYLSHEPFNRDMAYQEGG